jgi:hypothetical protein
VPVMPEPDLTPTGHAAGALAANATAKRAGLAAGPRAVYQTVLRAFAATGRPSAPGVLENMARPSEHTGPWTPDDVEALPDAGDHARFEVYEGGVLVVSPAPGVGHQRASYRLHRALAEAAIAAAPMLRCWKRSTWLCPAGSFWFPTL